MKEYYRKKNKIRKIPIIALQNGLSVEFWGIIEKYSRSILEEL